MSFTHLHVHTEFSLLDGAIKVDDLIERVAEQGQNAVAITDHGWIAGAVKFTKAAREKDIKPIIGSEVYVATGESRLTPAKSSGDTYHLTLLAASEEGYRNLMRLSTRAHLEGLSYKPRIDKTILTEHAAGLILLSGCIGAELPQTIINASSKDAEKLARWYQQVFGDRFFIEVMNHGDIGGVSHVRIEDDAGAVVMDEHELNDELVRIATKLGIPVVATNDAHYLKREHGCAHDSLLCLGMGGWKEKQDRMRFPGAEHEAWEYFVKSDDEMRAVSDASWWQSACLNTSVVADMVEDDVIPMTGKLILPRFEVPNDVAFRVWRETGAFI